MENNALEGKKILWVEDDKFLGDIILRKLSKEKSTLLYAEDAQKALSILEEDHPDIILLDILLPGMNGFEFLEKIKADPKTKDIPVIMLSNLSQPEDIEKGKKLGAEKFLVKATLELDDIIKEVKNVLVDKGGQSSQ